MNILFEKPVNGQPVGNDCRQIDCRLLFLTLCSPYNRDCYNNLIPKSRQQNPALWSPKKCWSHRKTKNTKC